MSNKKLAELSIKAVEGAPLPAPPIWTSIGLFNLIESLKSGL
ncbi:MAG: hypothetical protein U5J96_10445 [Ignavibacteriaceae bacterium]|nr:hypothetical protein [Ignavibacteriaceae bacterium]